MRSWQGTIMGEPASKANSRRPTRSGKWIKSQKALDYAESAKMQLACMPGRPLLEGPLKVRIVIHYRTRRPDLDESLILDLLQGFVYKNDRQVVCKEIIRGDEDKTHPRAVILVEEME